MGSRFSESSLAAWPPLGENEWPIHDRRAHKKAPERLCPRGAKGTCFLGSDWTICGRTNATSDVRVLWGWNNRALRFPRQGRPANAPISEWFVVWKTI